MPTTEGKQLLGMFLHDECWLHGVLNREVNTYTQSPFRPFFLWEWESDLPALNVEPPYVAFLLVCNINYVKYNPCFNYSYSTTSGIAWLTSSTKASTSSFFAIATFSNSSLAPWLSMQRKKHLLTLLCRNYLAKFLLLTLEPIPTYNTSCYHQRDKLVV